MIVAKDGKAVLLNGKALTYDPLIALANATTGETDTTLTDAIQSLIDGFGGGVEVYTGTFTPSTNTTTFTHNLNLSKYAFILYLDNAESVLPSQFGNYSTIWEIGMYDQSGNLFPELEFSGGKKIPVQSSMCVWWLVQPDNWTADRIDNSSHTNNSISSSRVFHNSYTYKCTIISFGE